jgi:hypothetical protein
LNSLCLFKLACPLAHIYCIFCVHLLSYNAVTNLFGICLFHFTFILIQSETGTTEEFFLVTRPEQSGSPPARAPPPIPAVTELPIPSPVPSAPILPVLSKSQSFLSQTADERELTIDDLEDFEDDEDDEVSSARARRQHNDATDLSLLLPPFTTGYCLSTLSFYFLFFFTMW